MKGADKNLLSYIQFQIRMSVEQHFKYVGKEQVD